MADLWENDSVFEKPQQRKCRRNLRPISCLLLMLKLMRGVIAEVMYKHLEGSYLRSRRGVGGEVEGPRISC